MLRSSVGNISKVQCRKVQVAIWVIYQNSLIWTTFRSIWTSVAPPTPSSGAWCDPPSGSPWPRCSLILTVSFVYITAICESKHQPFAASISNWAALFACSISRSAGRFVWASPEPKEVFIRLLFRRLVRSGLKTQSYLYCWWNNSKRHQLLASFPCYLQQWQLSWAPR